ncbi:hypothetical protein VTN31DRAFT_3897 [Thermomyces dupontii]|uniref:uncharacterized protein n=1 Tax=Talaromyces thermophilus TaxID=28565 RepID=UPI0037446123
MSWLFGSSNSASTSADPTPKQASSSDQANKPKPCCVCKEEKAARDDCMLYSKSNDPQADCKTVIEQYRNCMAGYGFKI